MFRSVYVTLSDIQLLHPLSHTLTILRSRDAATFKYLFPIVLKYITSYDSILMDIVILFISTSRFRFPHPRASILSFIITIHR